MNPKTTREKVLDAFADELLESGYRGVSLKSVSSAAGIKRPSLYHFFPNGKEQIYTEVALRIIDVDAVRVDDATKAPGGLAGKLHILAQLHADDPRKVRLDQRIYDATRYVSETTRKLISTRYVESLLIPAQAVMVAAVDAGELRDLDPEFLMSAFLEMAKVVQGIPDDVAMPPEHRQSEGPSRERLASQVVDLFLSGARRPAV
jgi:AcrR family transcriptional regulator